MATIQRTAAITIPGTLNTDKIYILKLNNDISDRITTDSQISIDLQNSIFNFNNEKLVCAKQELDKPVDLYRQQENSLIKIGESQESLTIAPGKTAKSRVKMISQEEDKKRKERVMVVLDGEARKVSKSKKVSVSKTRSLSSRPPIPKAYVEPKEKAALLRKPISDPLLPKPGHVRSLSGNPASHSRLSSPERSPKSTPLEFEFGEQPFTTAPIINEDNLFDDMELSPIHEIQTAVQNANITDDIDSAIDKEFGDLDDVIDIDFDDTKEESNVKDIEIGDFKPIDIDQSNENSTMDIDHSKEENHIKIDNSKETKIIINSQTIPEISKVIPHSPAKAEPTSPPKLKTSKISPTNLTQTSPSSDPVSFSSKSRNELLEILELKLKLQKETYNSIQDLKSIAKSILSQIKKNTFDPNSKVEFKDPQEFETRMKGFVAVYEKLQDDIVVIQKTIEEL
jgi:hypothetical protein